MKSMTGFGRGFESSDDFAVTVEIKTVNNRFLDINLRLKPNCRRSNRRSSARSAIGSRGRVDVNLTLRTHVADQLRIEPTDDRRVSCGNEADAGRVRAFGRARHQRRRASPQRARAEKGRPR
ncbi:MAG: hypothetical protein IPJ30_25805 [Acidobacteria bacterium]|nr:hypothetical protein [Acidobacteriota bacterium]